MEGDEGEKVEESHHSSAAAFVEGGIQDACDDACSICLEEFSEGDPSAVTNCKHEFHLQCVLEWCQRSSQCPMCWQPISMKDPTSQELFESVERERKIRSKHPRSTAIFRHPALGDFELQHLPAGINDAELEERIFRQLAAAAAMGRAHLIRREGRHGRSGINSHPQYFVFSSDINSLVTGPIAASPDQREEENDSHSPTSAITSSISPNAFREASSSPTVHTISSRSLDAHLFSFGSSGSTNNLDPSYNQSSSQPTIGNHDEAGSSDGQSFSESLKSRLSAASMKYKESITRSTRSWRERLFSRNNSVADIGSDIRREVNAGVATISRMIERLDISRGQSATELQNPEVHEVSGPRDGSSAQNHDGSADKNMKASASNDSTSVLN